MPPGGNGGAGGGHRYSAVLYRAVYRTAVYRRRAADCAGFHAEKILEWGGVACEDRRGEKPKVSKRGAEAVVRHEELKPT